MVFKPSKIKYPLATESWDQAEKDAAKAVIDSGLCTMGKITKAYESKFAQYIGAKHCVFVNSGSSANLLAVTALMYYSKGLKQGDEVIVPAVSWSTTFYPFQQCGLKLKFVDVDPETFNIDIDQIKQAITPETKAICAVNLLGNACDFAALQEICNNHHLILIEDNCESLAATYQGKQCGTYGLLGTYSSYFSHHISTVEGGMVATDDEELYQLMLCLRSHGWIRDLPDENRVYNKSGNAFTDSFKFILIGYNIRGNDVFASIGLEQLKKLDHMTEKRKANAKVMAQHLDHNGYLIVDDRRYMLQKETKGSSSSWFGFGFICMQNDRDQVVKRLVSHGIDCRPIVTGNFCKNPVIQHFDHEIQGDLPHANTLDQYGFFIGNNGTDLTEQIAHFITVIST